MEKENHKMKMFWTYTKARLTEYIDEQRRYKTGYFEWMMDMVVLPIALLFYWLDYLTWDCLHFSLPLTEEYRRM
jgi:hypothetical protein